MRKEAAVIFDIDGTLAKMGDRYPYDWERVGEDRVNVSVRHLLYMFQANGYEILLFSGRDSSCRKITEDWLARKNITYDLLLMRPEKDNRSDVEIKKEMLESVGDKYDTQYVVDDRLRVCRMWHKEGLTLLRVGDPDADF